MPRFILRFRGNGPAQEADVNRIRALPEARVIDTSSPRMMLVEAPEEHLRNAISDMPGWVMSPEQTIQLPDPRQKVLHPPEDTES
jgi:hypothetical protein